MFMCKSSEAFPCRPSEIIGFLFRQLPASLYDIEGREGKAMFVLSNKDLALLWLQPGIWIQKKIQMWGDNKSHKESASTMRKEHFSAIFVALFSRGKKVGHFFTLTFRLLYVPACLMLPYKYYLHSCAFLCIYIGLYYPNIWRAYLYSGLWQRDLQATGRDHWRNFKSLMAESLRTEAWRCEEKLSKIRTSLAALLLLVCEISQGTKRT